MISKVSLKISPGISSIVGDVLFGSDKMTRLRCSMVMGVIVIAPAFTRGRRMRRGDRPDRPKSAAACYPIACFSANRCKVLVELIWSQPNGLSRFSTFRCDNRSKLPKECGWIRGFDFVRYRISAVPSNGSLGLNIQILIGRVARNFLLVAFDSLNQWYHLRPGMTRVKYTKSPHWCMCLLCIE